MAATNLQDVLDPALTRPDRFDRHIVVTNPDVRGRQEILELYLLDKPLGKDVDVKAIARGTPGFNGADIANLVNIAAIKAVVEGAEKLTAAQLQFAKDRIMMGTEMKTMFLFEESKKFTAYHESGERTMIFLINNGRYTIEVEIHDGPYNVIKNLNYTALVDAMHNNKGNCWTTKVHCE